MVYSMKPGDSKGFAKVSHYGSAPVTIISQIAQCSVLKLFPNLGFLKNIFENWSYGAVRLRINKILCMKQNGGTLR